MLLNCLSVHLLRLGEDGGGLRGELGRALGEVRGGERGGLQGALEAAEWPQAQEEGRQGEDRHGQRGGRHDVDAEGEGPAVSARREGD